MKVALAGQGAFGIKHLEALANIDDVEVVSLAGGSPASTEEVARKWNIQPVFTFAYWADQAPRVAKAWDILLKTLILGDYIEDPTQRVSLD